MKKSYINPAMYIVVTALAESVLNLSNQLSSNGSSVVLNPSTMGDGDGSDAVKSYSSYNVWDDDWSQ